MVREDPKGSSGLFVKGQETTSEEKWLFWVSSRLKGMWEEKISHNRKAKKKSGKKNMVGRGVG